MRVGVGAILNIQKAQSVCFPLLQLFLMLATLFFIFDARPSDADALAKCTREQTKSQLGEELVVLPTLLRAAGGRPGTFVECVRLCLKRAFESKLTTMFLIGLVPTLGSPFPTHLRWNGASTGLGFSSRRTQETSRS